MLFDLKSSPRRRRTVQIVFGGLALLFAVSFVGFGIGSDASGGIFDALGLSGDDDTPDNPEFEQRIEDANAALEADPKDEDALLELAEVNVLAGNDAAEQDPQTLATIVTSESEDFYDDAIDSWESYLALKPNKPDEALASLLVGAYINMFQAAIGGSATSTTQIQELLDGAVKTQAIFAEAQPSANTYFQLAELAYLAGDTKQGDEAAALALEKTERSERKSTEKALEQIERSGEGFQKSLAKADKAQETEPDQTFENPLEDTLGGGGLTPPAPSP